MVVPFSYIASQSRGAGPAHLPPRAPAAPPPRKYIAALTVGQPTEPTALAVLEVDQRADTTHYAVVGLKRWEMFTPYQDVFASVASSFAKPHLAGSVLCVERTGVGQPIYDLLRRARPRARLFPLVLVNGGALDQEVLPWSVPKRDLAATVASLLGRNLHIAPGLELAELLSRELDTFSLRIHSAPEGQVLEALRQAPNEDLILGVATAAWFATKGRRQLRISG